MNWLPSELTLAKVIVTLTVLMVAFLLLVPHAAWQGVVALATVLLGLGVTAMLVVLWRLRGLR